MSLNNTKQTFKKIKNYFNILLKLTPLGNLHFNTFLCVKNCTNGKMFNQFPVSHKFRKCNISHVTANYRVLRTLNKTVFIL